ncbi:hypothetical protein SAMN05443575_3496 [Jatrophihabitans endophyticus]|uniref:Uncharacterized protein n=1 Tax=Jatrophihabitans endophyticus TaxID=1206085 RepID=A0A1M5RBR2_9ACTN|nr:hypothetical protein SAMN05443575_3496 [Jatrophihabitans endophyticus]
MAAAAARIEGAAEHARQRASLLATATAHSGWDGDGARAFEQREHELLGRVRRAASELDDAAAALRQHGAAVRRELERRDAHLGQWLR